MLYFADFSASITYVLDLLQTFVIIPQKMEIIDKISSNINYTKWIWDVNDSITW